MVHFLDFRVSRDIKTITLATVIRWFGWGMVETLIPVFLFSFTGSYAETGLLKSAYGIIFFLSVPIVGLMADRIALKRLLLIGLGLYFIVGLSYFAAAVTGAIVFVLIARAVNGVSYAIDSTARDTAFLRSEHAGRSFAYFETTTSFWWAVSVAVSFVVAPYVHIKWLFMAIVVANLFAIPFMLRLRPMHPGTTRKPLPNLKHIARSIFRFEAFKHFKKNERLSILIIRLLPNFVLTLPMTFLPIFSYVSTNDIRNAILIGGLTALPGILSAFMGKWSDAFPKRSIVFGFVLLIISFIIFTLSNSLVTQLFVAFLAGLAAEIMYLAAMVFIKQMTDKEYLGSIDASLESLVSISDIVSGIVLGLLIDLWDAQGVAYGIIVALSIGLVYLLQKWSRYRLA
jgi:MFS family permease